LKTLSIFVGQQVDGIKQQVIIEVFIDAQQQKEVKIPHVKSLESYDLEFSL
jgi:hypothetical protein